MSDVTVRETILDLLLRIEQDSGYSHLLIDHEMRSRKIPLKDEALLTEIVYGTTQRKLTLDYYLEASIKNTKKIQPWVRMLLRMSVYQMIFLDKVPDHAIIHEAVEIAKKRGHKGIASFINGILRNIQRNGVTDTGSITDSASRLSIETSHPKWLVKRWIEMYGYEITSEMCHANLERKDSSVRVQPMKIGRDEALSELEQIGFTARPSIFSAQGIVIEKGNILKTRLFTEGCVTIQDQSSMLVAEMLDVQPGMTVLDACSAPGGKATHIAEKMENQGTIMAYDLHAKKAKQIKEKATTLDLTIINANQGDARKLQSLHGTEEFDRILVDAPCSGLGVIRGKPDIKYNKKEDDIYHLAKIQRAILEHIAPLLKKGGKLIYSTCTVDQAENDAIVTSFLSNHSNFQMDQTFFKTLPSELKKKSGLTETGLQLFPQHFSTDGFFLTRLQKV